MTVILGVDPGQAGGLALVGGDEPYAQKMPATERDIYDAIHGLAVQADRAVIEAVHSMPKQGVASSFKFGRSYGFLRACLIACGITWEAVAPGKWQKAMGLIVPKGTSITDKKNLNKSRAQELFPSLRITHSIADALLLAEWCRREQREPVKIPTEIPNWPTATPR